MRDLLIDELGHVYGAGGSGKAAAASARRQQLQQQLRTAQEPEAEQEAQEPSRRRQPQQQLNSARAPDPAPGRALPLRQGNEHAIRDGREGERLRGTRRGRGRARAVAARPAAAARTISTSCASWSRAARRWTRGRSATNGAPRTTATTSWSESEAGYRRRGRVPGAAGGDAAARRRARRAPALPPHLRHLPATFGMVELDRLIVYQPHVTLPFVEALQARLAPAPDAGRAVPLLPAARAARPAGDGPAARRPAVPVRVATSTDFRFHEAALLRPEQIAGLESFGPVGAVVGLVGRLRVELPERDPLGQAGCCCTTAITAPARCARPASPMRPP